MNTFLVSGILLIASVSFSPGTVSAMIQDQANAGNQVESSVEVRRQVTELGRQFRRANGDISRQAEIVAQSIQLGRPWAEKLREIVELDLARALESYGKEFSRQIQQADKITTAGVVAKSKRLQQLRQGLTQRGEFRAQLQEFLQPNPDRNPGDDEPDSDATPGLEDYLREQEERAVKRWLRAQGYGDLTAGEMSVIQEINRLRDAAGLGKLEIDYKLCLAARDHSADMANQRFFSHKSPVRGKRTFSDRAARLGTVAHAENIADCSTGGSPVTLWINSKPHYEIMYGKWFNTIGVGRAGSKYTAMFAVRRERANSESAGR